LNVRQLAVQVLTKMEEQGAYSNLVINQVLEANPLDRRDANLLTEIVYGTTQRLNTIDYFLLKLIPKGMDSYAAWLRACLRMSLYQILYLDKIPHHAIVNEAVHLAKKKGHLGIAKLVNGVLRNAIRKQSEWQHAFAALPTPERLSLQYSLPRWLVKTWLRQFAESEVAAIGASLLTAPKVSVRVNRMKTDREQLFQRLLQEGANVTRSALAPDGLLLEQFGNAATSALFHDGIISIQDESSMLVARVADPKPGMRVLDCCAAPGGKTTHLAELMNDEGAIVALDLHEHKRNLIVRQAERLGLRSVQTHTADMLVWAKSNKQPSFDLIVLDAPCSGLGVMRRKPDLKWQKKAADLSSVAALQRQMLAAVAPLLKRGGLLVYSTCTVNREENEANIEQFLRDHREFHPDDRWPQAFSPETLRIVRSGPGTLTVLPHHFMSDGFFIVRLRKA
jgi:16S rRNA (cytosine967-C5)-methyltransferase